MPFFNKIVVMVAVETARRVDFRAGSSGRVAGVLSVTPKRQTILKNDWRKLVASVASCQRSVWHLNCKFGENGQPEAASHAISGQE